MRNHWKCLVYLYVQLLYATNYYVSVGSHHNFIFCFFIRVQYVSSQKENLKNKTRESNAFTYEHNIWMPRRVQKGCRASTKLGMNSLRNRQSSIRFCWTSGLWDTMIIVLYSLIFLIFLLTPLLSLTDTIWYINHSVFLDNSHEIFYISLRDLELLPDV